MVILASAWCLGQSERLQLNDLMARWIQLQRVTARRAGERNVIAAALTGSTKILPTESRRRWHVWFR